jgi:hypothetical protein
MRWCRYRSTIHEKLCRFVKKVYSIILTVLDIIHRPGFHLTHDVSETGFGLRLQVEPVQLDPIDR